MINQFNKTDLDSKIKDGKILMAAPKKDDVTVIGGGKGKKGKKPKQPKAAENSLGVLKIDLEVIQKFGKVGVSPPVDGTVLDEKIEELKKRLVSLGQEGEKELKLAKKEMEENLDKVVEDELERERKAAEEDEYGGEEEKSQPTDGRRYRGRGGGMRGDRDRKYGDYSPPAKEKEDGGYFGGKFGKKKPKGEFEGSDDEEEEVSFKSAYDKPSRGGG